MSKVSEREVDALIDECDRLLGRGSWDRAGATQSFGELLEVADELRPPEHFPLASAVVCAVLAMFLGATGIVLLVLAHGAWTYVGGTVAMGFAGLTALCLAGWTVTFKAAP